jgi:hypothetical protein
MCTEGGGHPGEEEEGVLRLVKHLSSFRSVLPLYIYPHFLPRHTLSEEISYS